MSVLLIDRWYRGEMPTLWIMVFLLCLCNARSIIFSLETHFICQWMNLLNYTPESVLSAILFHVLDWKAGAFIVVKNPVWVQKLCQMMAYDFELRSLAQAESLKPASRQPWGQAPQCASASSDRRLANGSKCPLGLVASSAITQIDRILIL